MVYDGTRVPTISSVQISQVEPGHAYKYRFQAANRVGQSALSPFSAVIIASSVPDRPNQPRPVSTSSTSITLQFDAVEDNGGSTISQYVLYVDLGTAQSPDYQAVAGYNGVSLTWTVQQSQMPELVTGSVYRFAVSAVNMIGESARSNSVSIALAAVPERPPQPTVDRSKSTLTSVHIKWEEGAPGDIPVLGYRLFQVELSTGLVSNVYSGDLNADTKSFLVTGLVTGDFYSFYVQSVNFNGASEQSEELVVAVCLAPTHIDSPFFISATKTTITLGWETHTFLGGCPTLGFKLH